MSSPIPGVTARRGPATRQAPDAAGRGHRRRAGWAAQHRDALRAVVAEHGAVLVRGLGLRDAAEVGAVFQRLATGLMAEREAFAPRQTYADGVYSSIEVAVEPADVHAPRTELHARDSPA